MSCSDSRPFRVGLCQWALPTNRTGPPADCGVAKSARLETPRFESDPPHRTHRLCQTPCVPGRRWDIEQVEEGNRTYARDVGRQMTFERTLPRVGSTLPRCGFRSSQ